MCVGVLNQGHPHSAECSHHSADLQYSHFLLNSILCISRLMSDYWCWIDLLWMQNHAKQIDLKIQLHFQNLILTDISHIFLLWTESIWNSRRSHRFKQALGLLIHHLINSALLYTDVGPVPIFLIGTSNTSNALSAQLKFGGLSQHQWVQNIPKRFCSLMPIFF